MDEERTIAVALLHDTMEDYDGISRDDIVKLTDNEIADCCLLLNKNGKKPENYFGDIGNSAIASLVKGADRIHNVNSMRGVFSPEKQQSYLNEIKKHFLPMLKNARNKFPEQTLAYFNEEHMLRSMVNMLKD